ncbi:hypothetical protein BYT27DRAFT_7228805 [Phlegmacium glaucopus]|nr:hypothetical protein BYT27DRAFT_7228805 [Phlegmacium glaucopus]
MSELHRIISLLDRYAATNIKPLTIKFDQILKFIAYSSHLKDDILLVQPSSYTLTQLPILSPAIELFLSGVCKIPVQCICEFWSALADIAWNTKLQFTSSDPSFYAAYKTFGHVRGIAYQTISPPSHYCMNTSCPRFQRMMLKKCEVHKAALFTVGVLSTTECDVNYHHNFRVFKGQRIYHDTLPDIIQVGEHQFVERKLINLWISMMLLAWTSATNCARMFNISIANDDLPAWQFNLSLTSEHVFDGFTILCLLEDCLLQNRTLVVPHGGAARDRFTEPVCLRNKRFRLCSQPELFHHCRKCTRTYKDPLRKVSVVVIDGVTVGHPCCGFPNCKVPLDNNRHRFCPEHLNLNSVCAIIGCSNPVIPGKCCCVVREHQAIEELKERYERAHLAHPDDSIGNEVTSINEIVEDDEEQTFEPSNDGQPLPVTANSQTTTRKLRIRAQFGRRRTHNEQLFVAPCGMIIARETFFYAEALYSVIEMIKRTYRLPSTMPDHIFFDNNCSIAKIVKNDPVFQNVGLTVDVFHFKCKHSEEDRFCRENCDPSKYPELVGEDGKPWYFNSSIAEQTNAWLGGYQAICREMSAHRYNFFLDEMIRRRNIMTKEKLVKENCDPKMWPLPAGFSG